MGAFTLTEAREMLTLYINAEKAILKGQSYSIGDRSLTRADLKDVVAERKYWEQEVTRLAAGRTGPRVRRVVPFGNR